MKNESYILKAFSAPDEKKEQILVDGVDFYSKQINKLTNEMLEKVGTDETLVLAALEINAKALRTLLTENRLELADRLVKKINVTVINLTELTKQAGEKTEE